MGLSIFCFSGSTVKLILVVFFHGEEESGLLKCSPPSKWDPNEQKELEVIQEVDEGEGEGEGGVERMRVGWGRGVGRRRHHASTLHMLF